MSHRFFAAIGVLMVATAAVSLVSVSVAGQGASSARKTAPAPTWTPPQTAWGHPDLQGVWNNATTTPVERPSALAGKEVLTDAELVGVEEEVANSTNTDRTPAAGDTGTYNNFWWERGKPINQTSLILDPPDGRFPPLTPEGQKRADSRAAYKRGHGPADSWEDRSLAERCIIYRGVPPFPTGYNNNYDIVQTPQYVAIRQEHIHEVRMIPLDGRPHVGQNIRQWLGDSRGHWEGNTLVVETTNFNDRALLRGFDGELSESLRVVERFTRVDPDTIDYRFTVEDPKTWTRPWSGAVPMRKIEGRIYEYACHEGNYGMFGILSGHRALEKVAVETAKKGSK